MDTTIALSSIGAIIGIVVLFLILKRVVGLFFRLILAGVLILTVIAGAWWWSSKTDDSVEGESARPRRTQRSRDR